MSVKVEREVVEPGSEQFLEQAWDLKQRIRAEEDILKQRRRFFNRAYRRSTVYVYRNPDHHELIGFAAVRGDGYLLFLAVSPAYRNEGFGEGLVAQVAADHDRVTCHARTSNQGALEFYDYLGFDVVRKIEHYYEDGGNAYYLRLGDSGGMLDRLSSLLRT